MSKYIGWIILGVVVLLGLMFVSIGNTIVQKDEDVNSQFANVDSVLQRRFDLIPNLVSTVKGYAAHEEKVFIQVTEARSAWSKAQSQDEKSAAAGLMDKALVNVKAVAEKYPDLKANQNFLELQSQLEGTENRISVERRGLNVKVNDYNGYIRTFPASIVASIKGLSKRNDYFKSDEAAKNAPKVSF